MSDANTPDTPKGDDARDQLVELAEQFYDQFADGSVPKMTLPTRSKSNIEYDDDSNVWVYGDRTSTRSANSVRGARKLLKSIYTIDFLAQQLDEDRSSTLRELYYLSESWDEEEAQFNDQSESDKLVEDLEIVSGVKREDFHMRPEESGAKVMGPLRIREQTNRGDREIHCQDDVGQGGYQIPNNPDTIEFLDCDAEFVMCVETGGMRDRLVENGFDDEYDCLVVHLATVWSSTSAASRRARPAGSPSASTTNSTSPSRCSLTVTRGRTASSGPSPTVPSSPRTSRSTSPRRRRSSSASARRTSSTTTCRRTRSRTPT